MKFDTLTAQMADLRARAPLRYALYGTITTLGLLATLVPIGVLAGALFGAALGLAAAVYALFGFAAALITALIPDDDIAAALGRGHMLSDLERE